MISNFHQFHSWKHDEKTLERRVKYSEIPRLMNCSDYESLEYRTPVSMGDWLLERGKSIYSPRFFFVGLGGSLCAEFHGSSVS